MFSMYPTVRTSCCTSPIARGAVLESVQATVNEVWFRIRTWRGPAICGFATIRVNGYDVEASNKTSFGLMCRLYSDGSGAPSQQSLRAAIQRRVYRRCDGQLENNRRVARCDGHVSYYFGMLSALPFLGAAGIASARYFVWRSTWLLGISMILLIAGFFQVYRGMRCRTRQSKTAIAMLGLPQWLLSTFSFPTSNRQYSRGHIRQGR